MFKHGENVLRKQKFQIALLDHNMDIYHIATGYTDDALTVTSVDELVGINAPYAYYLNLNCHGYGKFKIDERSMKAYEEKLGLIMSNTDRKLLFNIMFDMMKDGDISGAQFLNILKKNLPFETSEDVISENLQYNIPAIIKLYLPVEIYESEVHFGLNFVVSLAVRDGA